MKVLCTLSLTKLRILYKKKVVSALYLPPIIFYLPRIFYVLAPGIFSRSNQIHAF